MSYSSISPDSQLRAGVIENRNIGEADAALITRNASKQTYFTIRLLADRDRVQDAYRAYAYFRWVDDRIDKDLVEQSERIAFIKRQEALANGDIAPITAEERMLTHLLRGHPGSGLQAYIQNMLAVMVFDANRKGRLISAQELEDYTQHLAVAVTEALHYFIGHDSYAPHDEIRYLAVTAAHMTHMLRDAYVDSAAGYFNIPSEFTEFHEIQPDDVDSMAYQLWVKRRVALARAYFNIGRTYLAQVESRRCRLAGYAYMARFEWLLDTIEREGYHLRPAYPERKGLVAILKMGLSVLFDMLYCVRRHHAQQ